ncbi:integrase-like protein [Chitinophaga dinghuensis]|uniref:Integrase-like protein n=1 Tax=Chitinophaga dinghuensis TaxID=1539050 RepID=A0A327W5U4_9BACT|nr:site-specific integrase [Chitinophaga dinghuensis]RAJ85867.1 integrase-like protein [Chitinophaga dinghuensis]
MEVSFYLKRPQAESSTLFAKICYDGRILRYYLSEKIPCIFWNKINQRAHKTNKDYPDHFEFNTRLDTLEHTIRTTYRRYRNDNENSIPTPEQLKGLLDIATGKVTAVRPTFLSYFNDFIERSTKGTRISPKTKKTTVHNTNKGYSTTYNHLLEFQKVSKRKIDFDTIDIRFHSEYTAYLTHTKKLSLNTVGDHIKRIKTVMQEAKTNGIKVCDAFESDYFFKPNEETDSIYLNAAELTALAELDLSDTPSLDRARDLFLVGCYTGLRFSDYNRLTAEHIQDNLFSIKQTKTSGRVVIPVHPVIQRLLIKYNRQLPKSLSNQKLNQYIKEVCNKLEQLQTSVTITFTKAGQTTSCTLQKWEQVTSHTARRSFATNEYLAGTPVLTIMAITGHKTEKAFMRYIKLTSNEHAQLLKQYWEKRHKS